jgi:hypothetical protein
MAIKTLITLIILIIAITLITQVTPVSNDRGHFVRLLKDMIIIMLLVGPRVIVGDFSHSAFCQDY